VKPGLLLAGTDDGNVWLTHNDGGQWENLSDRFPGLPSKDVYVTRVEPSHFDTLSFWVAFDNHRWNDFTPYLYATEDGGKTFHSIVNNLPKSSPADYLHVIREDPHNRDLLFVGSSIGVYASIDRGHTWTKFSSGLPSVPVFDLKIHPRDHEVMIATHGRGIWLVDVAGLEQMTAKNVGDVATLYAPRTAYQWGEGPALGMPGNGWGQAPLVIPAPAYGAQISYRLKDSVTGPVRITVNDAGGTQLYTTTGPARSGVHSVMWGFQGAPPARKDLTPSEKRDSIILKARAPMVLDSLQKAGYDSAALTAVRRVVNLANNPPAGGAGFGRGGGGGGRGGAQAGCEHPVTQWDNFCARPAEPPPAAAGRGGRGGAGAGAAGAPAGAAADTSAEAIAAAFAAAGGGRGQIEPAQQKIWDAIGMKPPAAGGRGGGGFGGGGNVVEPGTYVVTLSAGGQTYKQTFRVERVGAGDDGSGAGQEEDENLDINGGIFPKRQASPYTPIVKQEREQMF
jgi:hypothetical protein